MKLGAIGFGVMGTAIIKGALNQGVIEPQDVNVFDLSEKALASAKELGLNTLGSVAEVGEKSDIILLAVKPQQLDEMAAMAGDAMDGKAVISILAGSTMARLKGAFKGNPRILRIMPNTPAQVFAGAFGLCKESDLTDEEKVFAEKLFGAIGIYEWVKEYDIDAICGVSGGGPAFVAMFIEALADGGVLEGLPRDVAVKFAAQTVYGTAKMILETGIHPGELKDRVSSPAGTTIRGVEALEKGSFRYDVIQSVVAGTERSREMGKI
jgi:pyrroline-5-carboxylate reductase